MVPRPANGVVPTIDDGGRIIWESNTIVRYLAAKYAAGSLWPNDPGERSEAERWMDWQNSTVHTGMREIFWGLIRTPPEKRDMAAITKTAADTGKLWARLDEKLAGKLYVAGRHFTMGDIGGLLGPLLVCAFHRAARAKERESLVRTVEDAAGLRQARHGAADVALVTWR
jgi:glutathione S-transferase